jgi:glycosyltransferase involved in cell wall biosynthesis
MGPTSSTARMRIAIVETAPFGGLLHYAVQLGDGLAARGHEVELIVPRGNELAEHVGDAEMAAVLTPPVRDLDKAPAELIPRLRRQVGVAGRLTRAWSQVVRRVRARTFDVVVINSSLHRSVPALGAVALTSMPRRFRVALIAHNADILPLTGTEGRERPSVTRAIKRRALAGLDLVFVHGERSRREYTERWPATRVAIIPHGDERLFGDPPPPANEERILFFGDWNFAKGLPVLMEAFDLLIERRPGVRLTIAGTPHPRDLDLARMERWASEHGDPVELIARYIPVAEVPGLFARARVVATPYVAGYQSGVVHLAMTMARAVVASDVGDLPSAVRDRQTGLIVRAGDPVGLSEALEEIVVDAELAERFGRAGRERVLENSGWERVAAVAEEALESLIADQPRAAPPR